MADRKIFQLRGFNAVDGTTEASVARSSRRNAEASSRGPVRRVEGGDSDTRGPVTMVDVARSRGRAKIAFGLSVFAAAVAIAWFWYQGEPGVGISLGALLMVAGYWEFRRRIADAGRAARAERERNEVNKK